MRSKYSWTHEYVDTGVLTMVPISSALLSIAWFHGPLMTRRFRSTDIHVMHVARYSSCHLIPNTRTHSHTKILIYHFSISWKLLVIWIVCNKADEGSRAVRSRGKTRPLFVLYFYISLFLCFVLPSWICFLFSPPWLEVHDYTSGPNLLKAFNKQTVLEKQSVWCWLECVICIYKGNWKDYSLLKMPLRGVISLNNTYMQPFYQSEATCGSFVLTVGVTCWDLYSLSCTFFLFFTALSDR